MKAILVSRTQQQLNELRRAVELDGHEVVQALLRKATQSLSSVLPDVPADLLLVDSGAAPQADLDVLAALTAARPALAVAIFSASSDPDILIAAMRAGVREVLPSPPNAADLAAALRRLAQRRPGGAAVRRGRFFGFVSCKGGSGATFLATNIAYLLAVEHEKNTALVDLDLQYGDASYFVTDQPGKSNLADLARQVERLDARLLAASMTQVVPRFDLLAAPEDAEAALAITGAQIGRVLDVVAENYEYVVLDIARVLDATSLKALDRAERVFLVIENMIPFVRDARRILRTLHALGYADSKFGLVVNRHHKDDGVALPQIERVLGLPVAHVLPDSFIEVCEAVNTGVALASLHPHNSIVKGMRAMADEIAGKREADGAAGWLGRLVGVHH